jgi:hypothetical protein
MDDAADLVLLLFRVAVGFTMLAHGYNHPLRLQLATGGPIQLATGGPI